MIFGSGLDAVAAIGDVTSKVQEELNTPAMVSSAQAKAHAAWMEHVEKCIRTLKDPHASKQAKSIAYWSLMRSAS